MLVALFALAVLVVSSLTAEEPKKPTRKDVAEMMKKTHRGEKSAYARTQAELKKDSPNWEEIAKDVKAFREMSAVMKATLQLTYTPRANYTTSVESLNKAVTAKDRKAALAAFIGLTNSCAACHYGGARAMVK
jgi:hypothetical protein